jgi:beta-N-acetylhexosaminidase
VAALVFGPGAAVEPARSGVSFARGPARDSIRAMSLGDIDPASAILVAALEDKWPSDAERRFFEREQPAGVTLFRRNVAGRFQDVRALTTELQSTRAAGAPPLMIAVDQEGGRVARLRAPFPDQGPAAGLMAGSDELPALELLENYGLIVGLALKGLGFNVDFAPVLDVQMEQTSDAIGDRAFGRSPLAVTRRAGAFFDGLSSSGVLGCLKHFPGQGAASADTHHGAALIERSREELSSFELAPFRELLPRAPMVMISHCTYGALDPKPASRSPLVIENLLRTELGFTGVVVSDDMNMHAVGHEVTAWQEALVASVAAGIDLLLVCRDLERAELALEALRRAAAAKSSFKQRLLEAATRVTKLRSMLSE